MFTFRFSQLKGKEEKATQADPPAHTIKFISPYGAARGVMVIVIRNGHGNQSLNNKADWSI